MVSSRPCYCLPLCHPLSLSLLPGRCDVLWSSKMKLAPVLSFRRGCASQTDCNYFLPGTRSVWRTKCTQNNLVTIGLVCTKICAAHTLVQAYEHAWSHKRTNAFSQTRAHRHKNKSQMNRDTKQVQLFLPCHAVIIPREKLVCLLMQQTMSVFWQFWNCCLHRIHTIACCSAFY